MSHTQTVIAAARRIVILAALAAAPAVGLLDVAGSATATAATAPDRAQRPYGNAPMR